MKKVYFISGLGADHRAFGFLKLHFCEPHFIQWPTVTTDTLETYAEKIFKLIGDEHATIVGLSFGGMLATEIAKRHPDTKVILISSCKTAQEIPVYLRMWRFMPLYKLYSDKMKKYSWFLPAKILGVKGKEQTSVQQQIINDSDPAFTKWAIHAILTWKNKEVPPNVTHLHGTADSLLPYRYVKADYTIQNGTHLMVMNNSSEIAAILKKLIL